METRTIHIKRTIDIAVCVPVNEPMDDIERWANDNLIPDCLTTNENDIHRLEDVSFAHSSDDQDCYVVVSWPESQNLCEYEGFMDNCTFTMGDDLPNSSYLVNKDWYSRLCNGELPKVGELVYDEESLC